MRDPSVDLRLVSRQHHRPSTIDAWPSREDVLLPVSQSSDQWQIAPKLLGMGVFFLITSPGTATHDSD